MKSIIALSVLFAATASQAATCGVEMAKKYVVGIENVAAEVTNGRIDAGDKVNGETLTNADVKAISADSAYMVTVTNRGDRYTATTYSKYVVTLKQSGKACFPASIVLIGNSSRYN